MKKILAFLIVGLIAAISMAFVADDKQNFIGTYGVGENDPSQIKLMIKEDHSFYYQDFSTPNNKLMVAGTWVYKGKKVLLQSNNSPKKFHSVWTFSQDAQIAKSRKGLSFYTLTKIP